MLKKVLTTIAILILVFVLIGALYPRDFKVVRTVVVNADAAKVHALVGDLKRWDEWTPWKESDPTIVTTFGPITTGVGASQTWTGKDGDGRLIFTKCDPTTGIACDMAFLDGDRELPSKTWLSYAPAAGGTQVEWGIEGRMDIPVLGGWLAMFSGSMIGGAFEKGLANLKRKVEGS
ncbi:MAG: SRPBCC family protein [Planctomycetes bacterium]|nr:SRPBCC family protein [Planctomycetota bacterium]